MHKFAIPALRSSAGVAFVLLSVTMLLQGAGVAPTTGGQVLWSAGMEGGDMSEWYTGGGGGEFNDPGGVSSASQDYAHGGSWSAKMSTDTTNGKSAVRLFRWEETHTYDDLWFVGWFYFPTKITVTGSFLNIWQYKSKHSGTSGSDPFWTVNLANRSTGSGMYLGNLFDWQNRISHDSSGAPDIPVGQWIRIKVHFVCSATGAGRVTLWQGPAGATQLIWDLQNMNTRYSDGDCQWSIDNYSDGLSPKPAVIYTDDDQITLTDPDLN